MSLSRPPRIQILSDLHTEFGAQAIPAAQSVETDANLVILAGDTAKAAEAVREAVALFPGSPHLVLVAGNHEHYGSRLSVAGGIAAMKREAERHDTAWRRVLVLENETAVLDLAGVPTRIAGATLWTDYALFGRPTVAMRACATGMNDHRLIGSDDPRRMFDPQDALTLHSTSRAFLEEILRTPHAGPTVVVTHHCPSARSVAPQYAEDPVTPGFASDLDDLIALGPALWAHGHTHTSFRYRDPEGTLVVCNPAGYADRHGRRENRAFDPRLIVELWPDGAGKWCAD